MKNDQYFPMEVQFLSNEDVMRMMYKLNSAESLGVYIILLQHLRKMDEYEASCEPISLDAIAYMYRIDRATLESVIRDYGLFEIDEEHQTFRSYYLDRVMQRLEKRRRVNVENGKKGGRPKKKTVVPETPMDKGEKPNQNQERREENRRSITTVLKNSSNTEREKAAEDLFSVVHPCFDNNPVWGGVKPQWKRNVTCRRSRPRFSRRLSSLVMMANLACRDG